MKFYSKQISGYEVGIYNNIIHELFLRPAGRIYYYWSLKLIVHSNKTNTINYYTNDVHDRDDRQAINNYLIVSTYAPDRIIFFYFALTWNFMVILDWMVVSRVFGEWWLRLKTDDWLLMATVGPPDLYIRSLVSLTRLTPKNWYSPSADNYTTPPSMPKQ